MQITDFVGKVVVSASGKRRYVLTEITAPYIAAETVEPEHHGCRGTYRWQTINGDPISNGTLVFEDESLTEPFRQAYEAYCRTEEAYWENYGYWMHRD